MDILNNLEWYFYYYEPSDAIMRDTGKKISKKQLSKVVFDDSVEENVKFCFPLNDDFSFTETRELTRPITVNDVLQLVHNFYNEPLSQETINASFGKNIEWKSDWEEAMEELYDSDMSKLVKYNLFSDDSATPDFCGIHLIESSSSSAENVGEYFINIGPE